MRKVHTHYDNLKVARDAPPEVIRAAYKSLSQKYHPDLNPGKPDAARIMAIINKAYDVLSDPAKRAAHDEWIRKVESGESGSAELRAEAPPRIGRRRLRGWIEGLRAVKAPPHLKRYWWIYVVVVVDLIFAAIILYAQVR